MSAKELGSVCLDGTKIEANASRHGALSHGDIEKLEAELEAKVQKPFALTEQADRAAVPDGVSLPDEIMRREDRLAAMAAAKAKIAVARDEHHPDWRDRHSQPASWPENATPVQTMSHRLETKAGRALYALRKQTVEPVFGIIKSVIGFRQFSLRGLNKVTGE